MLKYALFDGHEPYQMDNRMWRTCQTDARTDNPGDDTLEAPKAIAKVEATQTNKLKRQPKALRTLVAPLTMADISMATSPPSTTAIAATMV
jgi:hypothetical protein